MKGKTQLIAFAIYLYVFFYIGFVVIMTRIYTTDRTQGELSVY